MALFPVRAALITCILLGACDKPTPEKIDRWPAASDGVAKLQKVFRTSDLDAELRARAAAHLVTLGETDSVIRDLEATPQPALLGAFIRFLVSDAEVANELQVPTPAQVAAKDAIFDLRRIVSPRDRITLDMHLAEWLGGYYDGRAPLGRHPGEEVLAAVGSEGAKHLIPTLLKLLEPPADPNAPFTPVSDDLLRGLAVSGPLGVAAVLDIAEKKVGPDHPDTTLQARAIAALSYAFSENRANRRNLVPLLARIEALAGDTKQAPAVSNLAFDLLSVLGKPICLKPLASLARHDEEIRVIMALRKGLECAGVDGIIPMTEALRSDRDVDFESMERDFWAVIVKLGPTAAPKARTLLSSGNWLARLTGVKVLRELGDASDVARLRGLEADKAPLRGKPGNDTKRAATTLGGEARLVADHLEKKQ
jgi:hypothetical protein